MHGAALYYFSLCLAAALVSGHGPSSAEKATDEANFMKCTEEMPKHGLPPWALTIPETWSYLSFAFMDYTSASSSNADTRKCAFTKSSHAFGDSCGVCNNDCSGLVHELSRRISTPLQRDDADVIFLQPAIEQATPSNLQAISSMADLEERSNGKFYFIQKNRLARLDEYKCSWHETELFSASFQTLKDMRHRGNLSDFCMLVFRRDFIMGDVDLGEHDMDDDRIGGLMLGVTLPPGQWVDNRRFRGNVLERYKPQAPPPRYLMWFRGKCHHGDLSFCTSKHTRMHCTQEERAKQRDGRVSQSRLDLFKAFQSAVGEAAPLFNDTIMEWVSFRKEKECVGIEHLPPSRNVTTLHLSPVMTNEPNDMETYHGNGLENYFDMVTKAWFGLCPHGDQRWNLRFLELLSAGTIPVIIADGLTLPFSQVIDWDQIVVWINESVVASHDPAAILAPLRALAADPQALERRSRLGLSVFYTYFHDRQQRIRGFLASLGSIVAAQRTKFALEQRLTAPLSVVRTRSNWLNASEVPMPALEKPMQTPTPVQAPEPAVANPLENGTSRTQKQAIALPLVKLSASEKQQIDTENLNLV